MFRVIILLTFMSLLLHAKIVNSPNNDIVTFYKDTLKTLEYQKAYNLQKKSNTLGIEAKKKSRYLNLNGDLLYGSTKAKTLHNRFHTTDISITDTIDIFGKNADDIHALGLQLQQEKYLLQSQKEKLFVSLVDMITTYRMSEEKLHLYKQLYKTQSKFLTQLKQAVQAGSKPAMEAIRFENTLALFHDQIIQEENSVETMKAQFVLYSKHQTIPHLTTILPDANLSSFIDLSPQLKLNDTQAMQSLNEAKKIKRSWLPDGVIGINQQFNNDPTSFGDNYTLSAGISMHFDGTLSQQKQRYKIDAMRIAEQRKELELQRKLQFITLQNNYLSAKKSYDTLNQTLKKIVKMSKKLQNAYLKRYIDINSYLQTIQESISTQEAQISSRYRMIKSAIILNTLSSGIIYE